MPSLLSCKHGHTWLRKANTQKSREKYMQYSRKPSVLPPWRSHEEVVWPKPNYLSHQRNKTNNKHIALPLISYLRTAELARWWAAPRNLLEDEVRRMSSQLWGKLKGFSMGHKGRIESHQDKMYLNASKCLTGARDLELRDGPSCLISWSGHKASSFPVTKSNLSAAKPRLPIPLATNVRDFLCQIPPEMAEPLGQFMDSLDHQQLFPSRIIWSSGKGDKSWLQRFMHKKHRNKLLVTILPFW